MISVVGKLLGVHFNENSEGAYERTVPRANIFRIYRLRTENL